VQEFLEGLEGATGGTVKVELYTGGTMGSGKEAFVRTLSGVNDIGHSCPGYTPGVFPLVSIFDQPIHFDSSVALTKTMIEMVDKGYLGKDFANFKVLGINNNAPAVLFLAKDKVTTTDDLKGLKLRTSSDPWVEVTKSLGGVPAALPAGEVYIQLQKKIVDGTWQCWEASQTWKLGEVCQYATEFNLMSLTFAMLMNKDAWEALPKAGKDYLEAGWREVSLQTSKQYDDGMPGLRDTFEGLGGEILHLAPGEWGKMNELFAPIWDKWVADREAKGLPAREVADELYKLLTDLGQEEPLVGYTPQ